MMVSFSSKIVATGYAVAFFAVVAGITFDDYELPLSLLGVLTGVTLIVVGVQMIDNPIAFHSAALHGVALPLLKVRLRGNLAILGLVVASSAITSVTGEGSPVLCFSLFAALLVGISLVTAGVLGE